MKKLTFLTVTMLGLVGTAAGGLAQTAANTGSLNSCRVDPASPNAVQQQRALIAAKNLARRAAEQTNGGLQNYRAERAMHGSVGAETFPCQAVGAETYRFAFRGGSPLEVVSGDYATVSVVQIKNGLGSAVNIALEFNGSLADYQQYRAANPDQNLPVY